MARGWQPALPGRRGQLAAPPKCVVDAITRRGSLYEKGVIRPCTYAGCKDLEIAAVWDRNHLVDMLMGDPKWDAAIRKPLP